MNASLEVCVYTWSYSTGQYTQREVCAGIYADYVRIMYETFVRMSYRVVLVREVVSRGGEDIIIDDTRGLKNVHDVKKHIRTWQCTTTAYSLSIICTNGYTSETTAGGHTLGSLTEIGLHPQERSTVDCHIVIQGVLKIISESIIIKLSFSALNTNDMKRQTTTTFLRLQATKAAVKHQNSYQLCAI